MIIIVILVTGVAAGIARLATSLKATAVEINTTIAAGMTGVAAGAVLVIMRKAMVPLEATLQAVMTGGITVQIMVVAGVQTDVMILTLARTMIHIRHTTTTTAPAILGMTAPLRAVRMLEASKEPVPSPATVTATLAL